MNTGGSALFRQTLIVLTGALVLSHLAGFVALTALPHGTSRATPLSGIARQLAEPSCEKVVPELRNIDRLELARSDLPAGTPADMVSDDLVVTQLAQVLGVEASSLQLAWYPDSEIRLGKAVAVEIGNREGRLEETIFLGHLVFGRQWADHWCIGEIPRPRWYNQWQVRITLMLLISLVILLILAWWFARRLSRPIRDFATAADAIGRDEQAPLLEETGPTELRIAARALNAMQARIQQQLAEREAMIAAIAHDLRTPLSRIAFRVEAASPQVSESVQRDVEQMNAMLSATLEFAREGKETAGDRIVDLYPLLQSMVEDEQAIGHDVQFTADTDSLQVRGNDVQLNRLFQNLLDNARHFGGSAEVNLLRCDGSARVEISDRGPGIAEGRMEDMFRPFTRGEPSRNRQTGGMGLGLSITRAIARRYGGDITLANRPGGGLLVTVTLPTVAV